MSQKFSLHKFFKDQYLAESLDRASSTYVTPTTGIKRSTSEYVSDKIKSNAEKETNAMRLKESSDQTKIFSQSLVDSIENEIRKITGILENKFKANVRYSEFRFSDGTGGFDFKWTHGVKWGGGFGLSLRENGDHVLSARSYYGNEEFSNEWINYSGNLDIDVDTWKDLDDSHLKLMWSKAKPSIINQEKNSREALDKEAKAQSDYYGAKADTGRIGYGLSSQPRMRNENINDPVLMKMRAQQDQYDKELEKSIEPKVDFDEVLDLRDEKGDLERRIKNLYREMENDPDIEAEGGAVADQYGDELNRLETKLYKVEKQINQYDMNESLTESLNPEVSKALDRFIKAMAKRYSYSEKDAVFAIQAALKQKDFRDEEKSSKFKKSGEEAGFDMRGLKEIKVGDVLTKNGKKGKVVKVMNDMANVDFGNGDIYGITFSRIKDGKILKESTEKSWDAIDVSRKAEKELGNKEWNERTTKKLDMLKAFNKSGKFKKDWSEEKLQGWVDKNYSWEKLSQQFKLKEGSCGYTPDGEPRNKPSGSHLLQLKEKIYNSFKE